MHPPIITTAASVIISIPIILYICWSLLFATFACLIVCSWPSALTIKLFFLCSYFFICSCTSYLASSSSRDIFFEVDVGSTYFLPLVGRGGGIELSAIGLWSTYVGLLLLDTLLTEVTSCVLCCGGSTVVEVDVGVCSWLVLTEDCYFMRSCISS